MRTNELEAGHYLEGAVQLHVPPYQRPYEWRLERWTDLWRDLVHQYRQLDKSQLAPPHFMGAMILQRREAPSGSPVHSFSVIDGQQRLLTMFILLAAFRDHEAMVGRKQVPSVNDLNTITPKYGKPCPRLAVRPQNQVAMDAILSGDCLSSIPTAVFESPLVRAYRFFRYQLWLGKDALAQAKVTEPLPPARGRAAPPVGSYEPWGPHAKGKSQIDGALMHQVLNQGLRFLELVLEDTDEDSSVIFETMNSKSTPLRQFDLLRNSVFVRMPTRREAFYAKSWQPIEDLLTSVSYSSLRAEPEEQFLYEYMIASGEGKVSRDTLHRRWSNRVIDTVGYAVTPKSEMDFERQIAEPLVKAAAVYPIAVGQTAATTVLGRTWMVNDECFVVIREMMALSGGPAVPLVLQCLTDRFAPRSGLMDATLLEALTQIQSYMVRLILSGENLSPLRATLMGVASMVARPITPTRLARALTDAGWATDKQVLDAITDVRLEFPGAVVMPILRGIERQLAGKGAHPMPFGAGANQYSLEHLYPQTENIGSAWDAELTAWRVDRDDMDARRYVLGNLTAVTNYDNKRNGRKPFGDKRPLIVACAPLRIHDSITKARTWKPTVIDDRTLLLCKAALKRWPRP